MRQMSQYGDNVMFLLTDHLGSSSIVTDEAGALIGEVRYKAWGETRYDSGNVPTKQRYTGQREDSYINLYWYNSRWYDPEIGRWIQPDSIVPGVGENGNPSAVGYLGGSTYSPLTVDFHESQFLGQLNQENKARLQDSNLKLPPVPTNSIAFDRYAYSMNNPVRYVDPSGHFAFLAVLALITPVEWVVLGVVVVGVGLYFAVPGVREAVTEGMSQACEAVSQFAKGEYIPPSIRGEAERNAYREAVHAYKKAWGLGPKDDVRKEILDDIVDAIKKGLKPGDAADSVDGPPEADSGD
jgi:RHS repeat-associated protein